MEVLENYCTYKPISQEHTESELTLLSHHDSRKTVSNLPCAIVHILGFLPPGRQRHPRKLMD